MRGEPFESRFERRGDDDCWPWLRARSAGYGRLWHDGGPVQAHRVAYERAYGPIPDDHDVHHECRSRSTRRLGDDRGCVNPRHLMALPHGRHSLIDSISARNAAKTHCVRGHELTGANLGRQGPGGRWRYCLACKREKYRASVAA